MDRIDHQDLFKELISFVIEQAKLIEELPMKGSHVMASRNSESIFDHALAVGMDFPKRAYRKIGAVGELFVSFTPILLTLSYLHENQSVLNIVHRCLRY